MADISKISAVAIANVAKVDAVTKANIANINDLTIPSAFTGLLDTYTGAAAAYSTRRLYSLYTGAAMRVREDGTNTETDIGFDSNGDLDTAAIATHCGANNGYVRYWYDQSQSGGTGSGSDAGQATAGNQPQIYNGTAVITENGKPALDFDGANDFLLSSSPTGFSGKSQSAFNVSLSRDTSSDITFFWALGDASPSTGELRSLTQEPYLRFQGTTQDYNSYHSANTQRLYSLVCPGTVTTIDDYDLYRDGSLLTPDSSSGGTVNNISAGFLVMGTNASGQLSLCFSGNSQEYIFYNSDQSSNRSGIETNIDNYFQIPGM